MSEKPLRIQLKRTRGWKMPKNTAKVDRATKWGNPFRVGDTYVRQKMAPGGGQLTNIVADAAHAVSLYKRFTARCAQIHLDARQQLVGKNLGCWCALCDTHKDGKPLGVHCSECAPCHADVLFLIANK